jgi:SAM-dependent methyltransferase
MTPYDRQRLEKFYIEALKRYGPDHPKSVHWLGLRSQLLRFDALTKIADLSDAKILDVGCGLGDLYGFLQDRFTGFSYTGIDLVPAMVKGAQAKYPPADFEIGDVFSTTTHYDYLLASGSLTFNVLAGPAYYYDMIRRMYRLADKGVAFNMLDIAHYKIDKEYLAYDPVEVTEVCREITPRFKVVDNYLAGDFTVYLYK